VRHPSRQVRRPTAPVRRKSCRHFGDTHLEQRGFDDHFGGKFHAGRSQPHTLVGLLAEAAQTAIEIPDVTVPEEEPSEARERWISEVLMQRRHRALLNASAEAVAHDEVRAPAQLLHEARDVAKIVAVVGIPHNDELAARSCDSAHQGVAVSLGLDADNAGSELLGDFDRTVGAAVVGHNDLARDVGIRNRKLRLANAGGQRLFLIQTRHYYGQLDGFFLSQRHNDVLSFDFRPRNFRPRDQGHGSAP
jgi:hypothetical protein